MLDFTVFLESSINTAAIYFFGFKASLLLGLSSETL